MIDGRWVKDGEAGVDAGGSWTRKPSVLRGRLGEGTLAADPGRYRLYAAPNCPWAHRVLLIRAVLGLEEALPVTMAEPRRTDQGWVFADGADPVMGATALHQIYAEGAPGYTGRVTVPTLLDERTGALVSNDSADLTRMIGETYGRGRLTPEALLPQIDRWNAIIHRDFNNGVYRAGFAESQEAYEIAALGVFGAMDRLEGRLSAS
ncbi:MAG: glutathione-dependent reductase, partial [Pseudomonadota bacterium]